MALKYKIEWDPEEVAAGYDFSSIYEGVDDNSTVPVISSVVNTTIPTDHPAINIRGVVKEVARQVVEMVTNTTPNSTTMTPTFVVVPSSSTPSTISTIVKKMVEHLGKEPGIPVTTVCIIFYSNTHSVWYVDMLSYCTVYIK